MFGARSMSRWRGPCTGLSPSAAAIASLRTHRFRYHSARPPRSRTPCTMPGPLNQWWAAGSSRFSGLGPLRRNLPSRSAGILPLTGRSWAVTSSRTGANSPRRYGFA